MNNLCYDLIQLPGVQSVMEENDNEIVKLAVARREFQTSYRAQRNERQQQLNEFKQQLLALQVKQLELADQGGSLTDKELEEIEKVEKQITILRVKVQI